MKKEVKEKMFNVHRVEKLTPRGFAQKHPDIYQKLLTFTTAKDFAKLDGRRHLEQFAERCISKGCRLSVIVPYMKYFFEESRRPVQRSDRRVLFENILDGFLGIHQGTLPNEELLDELHVFFTVYNDPDSYHILIQKDLSLFSEYVHRHELFFQAWNVTPYIKNVLACEQGTKEMRRDIVWKIIGDENCKKEYVSFFSQVLPIYLRYDQFDLVEWTLDRSPELLHDYYVLQVLHRCPAFTMKVYQKMLDAFYVEKKYDTKYDGKSHVSFLLHVSAGEGAGEGAQRNCIQYMKLMNMDFYMKMIGQAIELKTFEVLDYILGELERMEPDFLSSESFQNLCQFSTLTYENAEDFEVLYAVFEKHGVSREVVTRYEKGGSIKEDRCGICLEGARAEEMSLSCGKCGTGFHLACLEKFLLAKAKEKKRERFYPPNGNWSEDDSDSENGIEDEDEEQSMSSEGSIGVVGHHPLQVNLVGRGGEEDDEVEYLGEVDLEEMGEEEVAEKVEAEVEEEKRSTFLFSKSLRKIPCCYCNQPFI